MSRAKIWARVRDHLTEECEVVELYHKGKLLASIMPFEKGAGLGIWIHSNSIRRHAHTSSHKPGKVVFVKAKNITAVAVQFKERGES